MDAIKFPNQTLVFFRSPKQHVVKHYIDGKCPFQGNFIASYSPDSALSDYYLLRNLQKRYRKKKRENAGPLDKWME